VGAEVARLHVGEVQAVRQAPDVTPLGAGGPMLWSRILSNLTFSSISSNKKWHLQMYQTYIFLIVKIFLFRQNFLETIILNP
jgi:hypothetical protein